MHKEAKVFVAGHRGLVGSALLRALQKRGHDNVLLRSRHELDLEDQRGVFDLFEKERPRYVLLAAAKVGGIMANKTYPAEFIRNNLVIQMNVIEAAYRYGVEKLLFLGSSCIYPRDCLQPIKEEYLLSGLLETTNDAYAVAKIAGIKMCQSYNRQYGTNFVSVMPTNLYGPGDNFDLQNSHVVPALLRKFHEAKVRNAPSVTVWGSGRALREFLFVDDMAEACLLVMERYDSSEIINIGSGEDISIADLAATIQRVVGYQGVIEYDSSKPDGTPRKLLDIARLTSLGWSPARSLRQGLQETYRWYVQNNAEPQARTHAGSAEFVLQPHMPQP